MMVYNKNYKRFLREKCIDAGLDASMQRFSYLFRTGLYTFPSFKYIHLHWLRLLSMETNSAYRFQIRLHTKFQLYIMFST